MTYPSPHPGPPQGQGGSPNSPNSPYAPYSAHATYAAYGQQPTNAPYAGATYGQMPTPAGPASYAPPEQLAIPTQSVLTITSNVVYGKATGSFPSGHRKGTPFSPGANPENGADTHGMLASMLSVGKLDYEDALDGISLTNTITPSGLGRDKDEQVENLVQVLDGGFIPEDSFLS